MPTRYYRPKGTRVSVHIPVDVNAQVARSPRAAAKLTSMGRAISARADATVPVSTDQRHRVHLKDTRLTEVTITPNGAVLLIGYTAWWAHFVHNGTVKMPANPWLLNAALSALVTGRVTGAAA